MKLVLNVMQLIPGQQQHTLKCNLSVLRKDFQKNETDGSKLSCMGQKQGETEMYH